MLYRPQRGITGRTLLTIIIWGVVLGIGFLVYTEFFASTPEPTSEPVSMLATDTPTPIATPRDLPTAAATPIGNLFGQSPDDNTEIFIPSVGIYAPVITSFLRDGTWDVGNLGMNVGYLQGTSWLDESGNVVLSGHVEMADGRQGIFSTLDEVQIGESIVVTNNGEQHTYTVRELRYVEPDDISVLYDHDNDTLTLITCSDYNFFNDTYETRLVVVADKVQAPS